MKLLPIATTLAILTEACSASPQTRPQETVYNRRVGTYSAPEVVEPTEDIQPESATKTAEPPKPEGYKWGIDSDADRQAMEEIAEIIAALAISRYAECIWEESEERDKQNPTLEDLDNEPDTSCVLSIEDEDTKNFLNDDIPQAIQGEIRARARVIMDEFEVKRKENQAKVKEGFRKLNDAIKNLVPAPEID